MYTRLWVVITLVGAIVALACVFRGQDHRVVFNVGAHERVAKIYKFVPSILYPHARVAWNSGAREHLSQVLRSVAIELSDGKGNAVVHDLSHLVLTKDFSSSRAGHRRDPYSTKVKWYSGGVYHDLVFYPVAVSSDPTIANGSPDKLVPQIIMVPLCTYGVSKETGVQSCEDDVRKSSICPVELLLSLFRSHEVGDAAVLMSNGSIRHLPVDRLETLVKMRNGRKDCGRLNSNSRQDLSVKRR